MWRGTALSHARTNPGSLFWLALLGSIVVVRAVLSLAAKPDSVLFSYSAISYFLLLLLATGFSIRNGIQSTLGTRPFWVFLAVGCSVWALDQSLFLYYGHVRHMDVPDDSIADALLFLHIVPLMAGVATLRSRNLSGRKLHRVILSSFLLLFFWSFFYVYAVFPFQYLFPNSSIYALRFDSLYLLENLALILLVAALSIHAQPPRRTIYFHLLGACILYALSSAVANIAIDSGGYADGKVYGLGLVASAAWFVWIPLRARQLAGNQVEVPQSNSEPGSKVSAWAMVVVVMISFPVLWELFRKDEVPGMRTFRLLVAVAAIVCIAVAAYINEYLAKSELASSLRVANDRFRMALEAGNSMGRDYDIKTGRDVWFGDLRTTFGIASDVFHGWNQDFYSLVHPEDRERVAKVVADARRDRKPYAAEFRVLRPDGTVRWLAAKGQVYYGPSGDPERMLGIAADITDRKEKEEALHHKDEEVAEAQHLARAGSWLWDPRTDRVVWSKELSLRAGHDPTLPAPSFGEHASLFTPESWDRLQRAAKEAVQIGTSFELDLEIVSPKTKSKWATARGEPARDAAGRIVGLRGTVQDITENKLAEERLRKSEERFRLAMEASKSVGWEWDLKTGQDFWFGDLQTMFGISSDAFVGRTEDFYRYVHSDDRRLVAKAVADARESHKPYAAEFRVVKPDGTVRWVSAKGNFHYGTDGDPLRMLGMATDITERKRAQEELQQSEQRFRLAVHAGRMYAFDWDVVNDVITRSPESTDILHWTSAECDSGREFHTRIHPDDREQYDAVEARFSPERPTYQTSFRVLSPDGNITWLEDTGQASFDDQGRLLRVMGVVADITERKKAEEALKKSEEMFSKAFRQSPMGFSLTSARDHRYIDVNETFERLSGWRREEVIGRTPLDIGLWVDPAGRVDFAKRVQAEGFVRDMEVRLRTKDGSILIALVAAEVIELKGEPCIIAVAADITARKQAEEARRESEDKLRLLLDSTAEAIYGIDLEHRCTFCNPACLRTLGYESIDEVLGKHMHELIHHTLADGTSLPVQDCRVHRVLGSGEGVHADDELFWRANGTSFPAEYWSYPQRRGQETVGAVVAFIDITQRKLAEAALANVSRKLIESQEQERTRIGRELHDDIGQRLALLAVELEQLGQDLQNSPKILHQVGEFHKQTLEIAADIQSLSHELHSAKLQYLGVAAAMKGFCQEFGEQQKVKIDFKAQDLPGSIPPDISLCFFRLLQEALHNSAKHSGGRHFEVRLWGASNEIHLTVVDSGVGFDREAAKASRGLGLTSMEERLKLVNGTLSIKSELQRGTTIHARVPLSSGNDSMRAGG